MEINHDDAAIQRWVGDVRSAQLIILLSVMVSCGAIALKKSGVVGAGCC